MNSVSLVVEPSTGSPTEKAVTVERIVNCGYTGRDRDAVDAHVEELEGEGVAPPDMVPTLYAKPRHLLSTERTIEVMDHRTSGEAEFVLLDDGEDTYVGVGSDHTDRALEREDVPLSKIVCPNVVGSNVWRLVDVVDQWDCIELRSWTIDDGERTRYQDTTLDAILTPGVLQEFVAERISAPLTNTAIFSGSVATETDELYYGSRFEVELFDPVLKRNLTCRYDVDVIDWA